MESLSLHTVWLSVLLAKDMESTNGRISSVQCYQTNGQLLCTAETAIIGNGSDLAWVNVPDQQEKTGIEKLKIAFVLSTLLPLRCPKALAPRIPTRKPAGKGQISSSVEEGNQLGKSPMDTSSQLWEKHRKDSSLAPILPSELKHDMTC